MDARNPRPDSSSEILDSAEIDFLETTTEVTEDVFEEVFTDSQANLDHAEAASSPHFEIYVRGNLYINFPG